MNEVRGQSTGLGGSSRGQCLGQTRIRPPPCILLHNTECTVHPTAQPLLHRAVLHVRFLDQIPLLLLLSFWLIMHTLGNCVWSNVVVYRIYIFFIFDFHKLKWDTTMRWERILRHYFFSKCLYFWCKRNIMNSYKYFYGETLLAK